MRLIVRYAPISVLEGSRQTLRFWVGAHSLDAMGWDVAPVTLRILFNFVGHDMTLSEAREVSRLLEEAPSERIEYVFTPKGPTVLS